MLLAAHPSDSSTRLNIVKTALSCKSCMHEILKHDVQSQPKQPTGLPSKFGYFIIHCFDIVLMRVSDIVTALIGEKRWKSMIALTAVRHYHTDSFFIGQVISIHVTHVHVMCATVKKHEVVSLVGQLGREHCS